jgi:hypothetical protein
MVIKSRYLSDKRKGKRKQTVKNATVGGCPLSGINGSNVANYFLA